MIFYIIFVLINIAIRFLSILIHELGHALTALWLTGRKTVILVGSFKKKSNFINLHLGLLEIKININPLSWNRGLCMNYGKPSSLKQEILILLAGAITTFLVALIALLLLLFIDANDFFKLFFTFFLISSVIDLYINLVPNPYPVFEEDGSLIYNDGYQIQQLLKRKKLAKTTVDNLVKNGKFVTIDNLSTQAGAINSLSIKKEALFNGLGDPIELNNFGDKLLLQREYERALFFFNEAIKLDSKFAAAYNNRGHCKILMKDLAGALKDITHSWELDKGNAYVYRNLGIYYLAKADKATALQLFIKAQQMDNTVTNIHKLIAEASKTESVSD